MTEIENPEKGNRQGSALRRLSDGLWVQNRSNGSLESRWPGAEMVPWTMKWGALESQGRCWRCPVEGAPSSSGAQAAGGTSEKRAGSLELGRDLIWFGCSPGSEQNPFKEETLSGLG